MLGTAAAAWEALQAKSCAGIMNNRNHILLYTFSPSRMVKQSMDISPLVFHEGARVKSRVTPLIDTNKLTRPLDE
jgi:hypothetical protein